MFVQEETEEESFKPDKGCAMYAMTTGKKGNNHPSARTGSSSIVFSVYHIGASACMLLAFYTLYCLQQWGEQKEI